MKVGNETLQMCGFLLLLPASTNLLQNNPVQTIYNCRNIMIMTTKAKLRRWLFPPTTKHKTLANKPPSKSKSTKPLITSLLQNTNPRP
jgi:hypothetical protein